MHGEFFVDGDDAENLTPLPGALDAVARALNERGVAAGDSIFFPEFTRHATIWQNGVFTDLHPIVAPDALNSFAADINDHGTIIGTRDSGGFRLEGTQVTAVTVVPGETTVNPVAIK